jgi:hypothetical protein
MKPKSLFVNTPKMAWRTVGDEWTYEYQLKPMGLLTVPRLVMHGR